MMAQAVPEITIHRVILLRWEGKSSGKSGGWVLAIRQENALHPPAAADAWLPRPGGGGHRLLQGLPAHHRPEVPEVMWLSTPVRRPGSFLCPSAILSRTLCKRVPSAKWEATTLLFIMESFSGSYKCLCNDST